MADNEINVRVTATTDGLDTAMRQGSDSVNEFGKSVDDVGPKVSALSRGYNEELLSALNAVDAPLKQVSSSMVVATTTAQNFSLGTAGVSRELVVLGREAASGNLTRLPGSLTVLLSRMNLLTPATFAWGAAIAAVGYGIYEFIESGIELERELGKIQAAFDATGRGSSFSAEFSTNLINQVRQASDVTREQAAEIVRSFASIRTLGTQDIQAIVDVLPNFKAAMGDSTEAAAKGLEKAFGGNTIELIDELSKKFGVFTADQLAAANAAKETGNEAELTRIAIQGLNDVASRTPAEVPSFWHQLGLDFRGVNEQALLLKNSLNELADANAAAGANAGTDVDSAAGKAKYTSSMSRFLAQIEALKSRNLPDQPNANAASSIDNSADAQKTKELQAQNDAAKALVEQFDKSNAPLREQEVHLQRIKQYQDEINLASKAGNDQAVRDGQALIEQENKQYAQKVARQTPKAKVGTSDTQEADFQSLLNEETAAYDKQNAQELDGARKLADEKQKTAEASDALKVASGQMSVDQELSNQMTALDKMHAADNTYFDQLLELYKNDGAQYEKTLLDKQIAQEKFNQQVLALKTKQANDEQKSDNQLQQGIQRGMNQTVSGVLQGTQTLTQAFQRMGQNIVVSVVNDAIDKIVTSWLASTGIIEAAQTALNTFISSSSAGVGTDASEDADNNASAQIDDSAGVVFAEAFAWAIPNVGLYAAPGVAAGAAAATEAGGQAFLASAAGGWVVPNDQLAMVHENEMILPANLSQGIRSMIASGKAGGGGDTHIHMNYSPGAGVTPKEIKAHMGLIADELQKMGRNGAFGGMKS